MNANKNINIRVTGEQKEMLTGLADEYGKSLTDLVILMAEYVRDNRPTFQVKPVSKTKKND